VYIGLLLGLGRHSSLFEIRIKDSSFLSISNGCSTYTGAANARRKMMTQVVFTALSLSLFSLSLNASMQSDSKVLKGRNSTNAMNLLNTILNIVYI
jgi:hypothetical protein